MKTYQYLVLRPASYLSEKELNRLGEEGWNLVTVHRLDANWVGRWKFIFKREVDGQ